VRFSSCLNRKFLGLFCGCNFMFEQFTDVNAATFVKQAATASGVHLNRPGGVETCSFDLPDAADVTQGFFSLRYASTTPVRYSASRSLMATISDKVKGSGCWAQLTGQFAAEEMISVTCACKSTGVGRAMVFPPFYCRPPRNPQISASRGNSVRHRRIRRNCGRYTEQLRPTPSPTTICNNMERQ
jgi:hypothetical protein